MNHRLRPFLALVALTVLAGCETVPAYDPAYTGPFYAARNFTAVKLLPTDVRRVVVLPLAAGPLAPVESARALDAVLVAALQQRQRFEVVTASRDDFRTLFGAEEFGSASLLPHGMFERLARHYGADAALFVDLTTYQPYRPQSIGLRAKLVTLREPLVLWSFDEVLDAHDTAVANSARRHALTTDRASVPIDLSPVVLQSPGRFAAFAASEMFATLPPR